MTKKQTVNKNSVQKFLQTHLRIEPLSAHERETFNDFKTSVLVVSLLVNAAVLVGWIALQVTTQYDSQVTAFLLQR